MDEVNVGNTQLKYQSVRFPVEAQQIAAMLPGKWYAIHKETNQSAFGKEIFRAK